jgi:hypothetical protein
MSTKLKISELMSLPVDAITQTFAIIAKRGVGKTYTGSVMAEEFVAHGLPFVVLDPTGAWWGLRAGADGKAAGGLPVTIIGGEQGDVPLESTAGKLIAELVVEQPGFYIVDMSLTESNAQQDRFVTDFLERLYRLKAKKRSPLHLFIDEADSFAPQRPLPGQQKMLGSVEAIIRRGRLRGLGATLISQRAAVINKNVLTQTEAMIVLQTNSPQDQDAIEDWVRANAVSKEQRDEVMDSLASLKLGQCWIWSPAWLKVCKQIQIRERRTFNSSATPEVGSKTAVPQKLAAVDLEKLTAEIKATVERAKANDPAQLKGEIQRLRKELDSQKVPKVAKTETKIKEVPVLKDAQIKSLARVIERAQSSISLLESAAKLFGSAAEEISRAINLARGAEARTAPPVFEQTLAHYVNAAGVKRTVQMRAPAPRQPAGYHKGQEHDQDQEAVVISGGIRRMMVALAQRPGISAKQLGVRAGLSSSSGSFGTYLAKLRSQDWVVGTRERLQLTTEGEAALGEFEPLPTGSALLEYWVQDLGGGLARMLEALAHRYPGGMTAEELGEAVGMSASSGSFGTYLGRLRSLELITGSRAGLRATEEFFV